MERVRGLIVPITAALLLSTVAAAQQPVRRALPPETLEFLQRAPDLRQARLRLMGLRDGGFLDQTQMMDLARWLDEDLRGGLMRDLGVVDAVVDGSPKPPNPERTGSSPAAGRGVFSDEDVLAKTPQQLEQIVGRARGLGHTVTQNRFYAHIAELDTVVWKPGMRQVALSSPGAFLDEAIARALDTDFAAGAKPGALPHPLESVLENLTKGQKAFFEQPLPADYDQLPETRRFTHRVDAELELAAGAKDVVRSLDAAGLRERFPVEYERLDAFRRMRTSFADSQLGSFDEAQDLMRRLMRAAYDQAENQLSDEIGALERGLRSSDESLRRRSTALARELQERLVRMAARFEVLSVRHPEAMQRFSGRQAVGFWADQVERVRGLDLLLAGADDARARGGGNAAGVDAERAAAEAAERAAARARVLSITVDALQFAQCLAEGRTKTECFKEALEGYVIGELISQGIGYVTLVSANGGLIATAGLAGYALYSSSVQVYDAYLEYAAYQEASAREAAAQTAGEAARRARVGDLAARVAALEARVAAAGEAAASRRATLMSELYALETLRLEVGANVGGSSWLDRVATDVQAALEPCFRLRDISQRVEPYVLQAEQEAEAAEQFVRNAVALANSCGGREELSRAAAAENSARDSREEIAELGSLVGSDLEAASAAAQEMRGALGSDMRARLEQFTALIEASRENARQARDYVDRVFRFPDTVDATNDEIESQRQSLRVEYQMFLAAFPDDLIALLESSTSRLEGIRAAIEDVVGLPFGDWADRRARLMEFSAAANAQAEASAAMERSDLPFLVEHLHQCDVGGDFDAVALIDRIDTAGTVADLAIELLGRDYVSRRRACERQLERPATAPPLARPAPPTGADREGLLARVAGWQARLDCLEEGVRKHPQMDLDCNGSFMIGARSTHIEQLRRWIREAGLSPGGIPAPGPRTGSDSNGGGGSPAAGLLLVEMIVGDVRYYLDSPVQGQPLEVAGAIPSDATVATSSNAAVTLRFPNGARAQVGASTRLRPSGLDGGGPPRLHLAEGSVVVTEPGSESADAKEVAVALPTSAGGPPESSARLVVTTPHLEVSPVGTSYRVATSSMRTDVEVFEGAVLLRGSMLARGPVVSGDQGKPAFIQSLELGAGQSGFGIGAAPGTATTPNAGATPGWLSVPRPLDASGAGAPADLAPRAADRGGEAGASAPASAAVPAWLTPGRAVEQPTVLDRPDPWNDPQVQALIDQWLDRATPVAAATAPGPFRYSEWGQVIGPATVYAGTPDHPVGWTRHQMLWASRDRYTSLNVCTLGEFVRRQLAGEGLADCATGSAASGPMAPSGGDGGPVETAEAPEAAANLSIPTGGRLPGVLAVLDELPAAKWVNGRPDLRGRRELMLFVLAPDAPDFDRVRECLARAEEGRTSYEAAGGALVGLSAAWLWPSKRVEPRERLLEWLQAQQLQLPVAFEDTGDAALEAFGTTLENVTVRIDASGEIVEIQECAPQGLQRR